MAAIDGLSSGLDTTSIIKQLMQLEKQPQLRLQSRQSATESAILSLRTLNSKFLAISTATSKLGATLPGAVAPPTPAKTDWQLTTASSNDTARVAVSAVSGAPASSLAFNVKQLATAATYLGQAVYDASTEHFSKTGGATTVDTAAGQRAARDRGRRQRVPRGHGRRHQQGGRRRLASTVQVEAGKYRLQLTATKTGGGDISLTRQPEDPANPDTAFAYAHRKAGQNAELVLGGSGLTVSRPSNSISDVLEGVTLTASKADTQKLQADGTPFDPPQFVEAAVTVNVKQDTDGIAGKISALVDAANAARSEAKTLTGMDPTSKAKGRLYGDAGVRSLVDRVRSAIVDGDAEVGLAGVTVARDGTISFDKAKFLERLAKEPAKVEAALGANGMGGRLHRLADEVSRPDAATAGPGLIMSTIKSRESQVASLKDGIASWDVRLALKEKMLQRQYTALETALGKAKSQGQWLSGQLASLPQGGS